MKKDSYKQALEHWGQSCEFTDNYSEFSSFNKLMWTCSHGNSKGQEQDQAQFHEFFSCISFANILLAKSSHMTVRMETQTKFLRKECRHRGEKNWDQ